MNAIHHEPLNAETIQALQEVEDMKANPSNYKKYHSFSDILKELDEENEI